MNAILLTSVNSRQAGALRRTASATCVSLPRGRTSDDGLLPESEAKPMLQQYPVPGYRKWLPAGAGVETALFVSVQAVMLVCVVLVAVQLIATA